MNLNKLYFVEKYGNDWRNHYHKWVFTEKMRKIGDIYKVDMKRELHGDWSKPTIDHTVDAMRYSSIIKEPVE